MNMQAYKKFLIDSDNEIISIMASNLSMRLKKTKIANLRSKQGLLEKTYLNPNIEQDRADKLSRQIAKRQ